MLLITLTILLCGLISIASHVFRSLYKKPDFSELENRLVVGTNFSFRTPRANPLARNLAQLETMHVSAKVCLQFFINPLVWILSRAELQKGTKIMMLFFGMPLRVN